MPFAFSVSQAQLDPVLLLGGNEDEIQDVLRDTFYEILDEFSHYETALESPKEDEDADDGT